MHTIELTDSELLELKMILINAEATIKMEHIDAPTVLNISKISAIQNIKNKLGGIQHD